MAGRIAYYGGIVTNGLILDLDAAKKDSYPTTGTAWNDISGNRNNGTLTNGPTFNSANGGLIVFDGIDDYVNCGNASSIQITVGSISAWVKTSTPGISYRGIVAKQNAWALFVRDSILVAYSWGTGGGERTTGINIADNTWKHVALTFTETVGTPSNNAVIYLNGSAVLTTTITNSNQTVSLQIAEANASQNLNGNISNVQVYNRVLPASEILQNFNAQKTRFGFELGLPSSGLIVNLDASNISSYSGTGTTWYDLSGTGNNAILANGVSFSTSYGGIFDFDGVDDYAYITDNATLDLAGDKSQGIWLYMDQSYSGRGMLGKADSSVNGMALTYGWGSGQGFQNIAWNSANSPTLASNGADISNWYYVAGVQSGSTRYIYVIGANGFRVASFGSGNHTWNNALNFTIGTIGSYYTNMKAGAVHVYNRALSVNEVFNIYATQKSRFGL